MFVKKLWSEPCHSPIRELVFNEQIILEKLNKLNISKSPGPDGIHPRVLFELWYELLEPLNILFESSYKLGKLPDEWKLGHVTAAYKRNKGDPSSYRPISLTSITHLVTQHKTHRGGLGLGGSVHEEAHPCFLCFIQPSFKSIDAGSIYHPLVQLIPSVNHSVWKKYLQQSHVHRNLTSFV